MKKESTRFCEWEDCHNEGDYPAPSRENGQNRKHFCLDHIRKYNKSWDFFSGMTEEQVQKFHINNMYGHRPTWRSNIKGKRFSTEDLQNEFDSFFADFSSSGYQEKTDEIPETEREALSVLNLDVTASYKQIKARYKQLVKIHHPDISGEKEGKKFKAITKAYEILKKSDQLA